MSVLFYLIFEHTGPKESDYSSHKQLAPVTTLSAVWKQCQTLTQRFHQTGMTNTLTLIKYTL